MTLKIGCHLSSSAGYLAMGRTAARIHANTFSFFTRNPRGGAAKAINDKDASDFISFAENHGISHLVAHAPYTLNPCSSDEKITEIGIIEVHEMLNAILTPLQTTTVLIETMSGKGSEIGKSFEEIRAILEGIDLLEKVGVCLDTCHIWDAGYDVRDDLDGVIDQFDKIIGLSHLKAIHLNDSLNPCGAKKDRHALIGEGHIGKEALLRVLNHKKLRHLPFILETPTDDDGHGEEIAMLRQCYIEK